MKKNYKKVHLVVLFVYVISIVSSLFVVPTETQAAWNNSKTWTTRSDFESGAVLTDVAVSGDDDANDGNNNDSAVLDSDQESNQTVAAGTNHFLAVKSNGRLFSIGYNGDGALGVGSFVPLEGWQDTGIDNVRSVSAAGHSLILKSDGTVWGAGLNSNYQLGDGATQNRGTFVQAKTGASTYLTNVRKIVTSPLNSYAITYDNKLFSAGQNTYYQRGLGNTTTASYWTEVTAVGSILDVAAGERSAIVLKLNEATGKRELWGVGQNTYGELGMGHTTQVTTWTKSSLIDEPLAIGMGQWHSQTIINNENDNNVIYSAGIGSDGRLGVGDSVSKSSWTSTGMSDIKKIFVGFSNGFAIKSDNTAWSIGYNGWGNLGLGDRTSRIIWSPLATNSVNYVSASAFSTIFLQNDGVLKATGANLYDYFPSEKKHYANIPQKVLQDNAVSMVDGAIFGNGYIKNGYVYGAGQNWDYRLGFGDGWHKENFGQLPINNVSKVEFSEQSVHVIKNDKTLWGMGVNSSGQIGVGNTNSSYSSFQQAKINSNNFLTGVVDVSVGLGHAIALTETGDVYGTGYNNYGQFGNGNTTNLNYWTLIATGVSKIRANRYSTVILKPDGTLQMAGNNANGNFGIGTSVATNSNWITVSTNVLDIYPGYFHNFIKKSDGIYASGYNATGALGDGTTTQRYTWAKNNSLNVSDVLDIATGYYSTYVLKTDGSVWSAGHNYYGQLGLGDHNTRLNFTAVSALSSIKAVSSNSAYNAIFLGNDGSVYTVGMDSYGQLGLGRRLNVVDPVESGSGFKKSSPYLLEGSQTGYKINAGSIAKWVKLLFSADVPNGSLLKFRLRGANSEAELTNVSWSAYLTSSGSDIPIANSQWLEIEVVMESTDGTFSPQLNSFSVDYYTDILSPTNPSLTQAWANGTKADPLQDDRWYSLSTPYFEWMGAQDEIDGSGVKGYWVYFGTDDTADPKTTGAFQTNEHFQANLGSSDDGKTFYLCISAEDNAGNRFTNFDSPYYKKFTYKYDKTAPTLDNVNLTVSPVGWSVTNNFSFNWTPGIDPIQNSAGSSQVKGYQYKRDNNSDSWSTISAERSVVNIQAYQNGLNRFLIRAIDNAGNVSAEKSANYYYNADAPSVPQNLNVTPQSSEENDFNFTWDEPATFNGTIKGYYYSINTTPNANNSTFTPNLSTGNIPAATQQSFNKFYVVAVDNTDNINWASYSEVSFECNTPAPGIPLNPELFDTSNRDLQKYSLAVNWAEPVYKGVGFAGYNIERSLDGVNFTQIGTSAGTSYIDTGLSSRKYYYRVVARDNSGNVSAPSEVVEQTPTGKYTTPASLTHGPDVETKVSTASVTWITERETSSFVEIGETVEYGLTQGQFDFTTDHEVLIERLKPDSIYHYRVKYVDVDGNIGYSEDKTLQTLPAPKISNVSVYDVRLDSAVITWNTSTTAKSNIHYGKESIKENTLENVSGGFTTSHSVRLTGLDHSSTYRFNVEIIDVDENVVEGEEHLFETMKFPKISIVRMEPVKESSTATMIFSWESNVPTSSIIEYRPEGGRLQEAVKTKLETKHEISVSNLLDNTFYQIQLKGTDQFGNTAFSDLQTFKTSYDTRPPKTESINVETSLIGYGSDASSQVVISWFTDEPSTSQVEYCEGVSGAEFNYRSQEDALLSTSHVVVISNLKPSSSYYFRTVSRDGAGNAGYSVTNSLLTEQAKSSIFDLIIKSFEKTLGWLFE